MVLSESRGLIGPAAGFLLWICAVSPSAAAYTQDVQLERALNGSDSRTLALFPAKGYKDGAAGFFRIHGLYVVPGSQRAWCTDERHGVLKPGCYVELFVQAQGLKPADANGDPCGKLGRWYRSHDSTRYIPTPGPFMSNAIANGDWEAVEAALYDEPDVKRLPARSCGLTSPDERRPRQP
jgi:hypothetical protein